MKIALVGIGKIAQDQHIPAIAASPDWDLAAAVSRSQSVDGVANYTDFDAMLAAHPDVPVVSLCLPPVPRFDYAAKAIAAGRHVMLEKPPGATLSEVHALQDMARDAGVTLYATWHSRRAAQVATAKAWLSDAAITRFTITWKEDVRKWHPGQEWIWEAGGLGVFDPGINALSIATDILPDPVHLNSAALRFPANRDTPIAADLTFTHPGKADVTAAFDWDHGGADIWMISAETDKGVLVLENGGATLTLDGVVQAEVKDGPHGEYPQLYADMARLVQAVSRMLIWRRCGMWRMPFCWASGPQWKTFTGVNPHFDQTGRRGWPRASKAMKKGGGAIGSDHVRHPLKPITDRSKTPSLQLAADTDLIAPT